MTTSTAPVTHAAPSRPAEVGRGPALHRFAREFAVVFVVWTAVALSSGAAEYALRWAVGRDPQWLDVLRRPLTEQWIWAALTPLVFHLARRVPLAGPRLSRAVALHMGFFTGLSLLHCVLAQTVGGPLAWLPPDTQLPSLVIRLLEEYYSDLWMYWPLVGIRTLLDAHARERAHERKAHRLEAMLARTRLDMLRAQIQPHFLFNTLHAVSALLRVDPRAAEDMIADLADLLRAAFADGLSQETPLRRELALVDGYLRIQQQRLGPRLSVRREIDPRVLDAAVPALLLQSLVENAVVHGIAPLARTGSLRLAASVGDDGRLVLDVADDGAGLPPQHRAGVGLANAQERLQQLYGHDQAFELSGAPGDGTRVRIRLPLRRAESADGVSPHPDHEDRTDDHPDADRRRRAAGAAQPVDAA